MEFLPCAKFTLRPSLAFSYIGSVTARQFTLVLSASAAAVSNTYTVNHKNVTFYF